MSLAACAEITRRGDPDRFLSAMAASPEARKVLFPIYAFNVEVARAPWVTEEPMIAEMRLQWWRDALAEIAAGGVIRSHEVVTELAHVLPQGTVPVLDRLIAARRWDIYKEPFEDSGHFDDYLAATSGGLMQTAGAALGAADAPALAAIGQAQGLANFWRAVPKLLAAGRVPLVNDNDLELVAAARDGLAMLATARRELPAKAQPAARAAWLAGPVLRHALNDPSAVRTGRLEPSEFRRRSGLLWRVALGRS
ncbi:MAG: squalene/phytoene synthase family protein [Paracoccaceae bacterium]